jgi:methanogenic corrinoid protein MtbC1
MGVLRPRILESGRRVKRIGTVVIGSVQTDIHEIGKNIVANMLSTGGFEVHDLWADVAPLTFIEKAEEVGAEIIAASAIMTTTMPYQKDIIDVLESMGFRDRFKVIVGGGPVNAEWAKEIGADGYAETAPDAVELVKELLSGKG